MLAVLVAMGLGMLEWRVVRGNVGAVWNGWGAVGGTWRRDNGAPMRGRVLVPWVLWMLGKTLRVAEDPKGLLVAYQVLKVGLLAGALAVVEALLGVKGMLVVAVLVATTFEFDYWDCYGELLGVGLVLWGAQSGALWAVAVGGVVWGLSKETALLAPVLGLLGGGVWCGLAGMAGPVVIGVVRVVQGRAELYCARWTLRVYNAGDLRRAVARWDVGPYLSIAWTVATVGAVVLGRGAMEEVMGRTAGVALAWPVAGWLMARARETRVFLPCALWMGAMVGR